MTRDTLVYERHMMLGGGIPSVHEPGVGVRTVAAYFAGDLQASLPEVYLAVVSLLLVTYAVAWPKEVKTEVFPVVNAAAVVALLIAAVLCLVGPVGPLAGEAGTVARARAALAWHGRMRVDAFTQTWKAMIVLAAAGVLASASRYVASQGMARYEFTWLVLWATLGAMLVVSAADFLAFYVALECGALASYILVASRTEEEASTQAGLTYFILGALASGLMLLGIALLYHATGTTALAALHVHAQAWAAQDGAQDGSASASTATALALGWVLVGVGVAWKVGAAPFHQWVPAVYGGAPRPVIALIGTVPKLGMLGFLGRMVPEAFATLGSGAGAFGTFGPNAVASLAVASLAVGTFGALQERRLLALLAYSAVAHMGYLGLALAVNTAAGTAALTVYAAAYVAATVGAMALVTNLRVIWTNRLGHAYLAHHVTVHDLQGLYWRHPGAAMALATFLFSMAGIPPLAGFLAKMNVFLALVEAEAYGLAAVGASMSVVAAYYYLRVVGTALFLAPNADVQPDGSLRPSATFRAMRPAFEDEDNPRFSDLYGPRVRREDGGLNRGAQGVVAVCLVLTVALMAFPDAFAAWADVAAHATLPDAPLVGGVGRGAGAVDPRGALEGAPASPDAEAARALLPRSLAGGAGAEAPLQGGALESPAPESPAPVAGQPQGRGWRWVGSWGRGA